MRLGITTVPSNIHRERSTSFGMLLRHLHARGIPCVRMRWIEDLLAFNMYSIALLKRNGSIVAGTMVKEFKKTVSFPFTCMSLHAGETYVYRLYWELIRRFALAGREIFHSGRIPNNNLTECVPVRVGGDTIRLLLSIFP